MRTGDPSSAYGDGRTSGPRRVVAEAAAGMGGAFTVADLTHAARCRMPRIGVATVYRAVSALHASGFLEQVGARDGAALYVRCDRSGHHHHLVCTGCGAVAETACTLDAGALAAAAAAGYVVTSHEMTVYGLCPACARGSRAAKAARG